MRDQCKIRVPAALSLILGVAAASALGSPVSVASGNSMTAGGWAVPPDPQMALKFALTGPATFQSDSDDVAPPLGTAVDHTNAGIGAAPAVVKYSGIQPSGTASDWGSNNVEDDLLVSADSSTTPNDSSYPHAALLQSPEDAYNDIVSGPLAAWQSLAGLITVALLTLRSPKSAKIPA